MYLPNGSLYVMTKKQILTAWSQSSNKDLTVHKKFDEKMISKTVINTGCNLFINTHPETENILEDDDDMAGENDGRGGDGAGAAPALEATEFQEATIVEDATVVDGGDTTTTTSTEDAAPSEGGDEDDF